MFPNEASNLTSVASSHPCYHEAEQNRIKTFLFTGSRQLIKIEKCKKQLLNEPLQVRPGVIPIRNRRMIPTPELESESESLELI